LVRWYRCSLVSAWAAVLFVVELMAGAAEDHDVSGQLCTAVFVGAVVDVQILGVGDVQ
jgi:hypothetical protein